MSGKTYVEYRRGIRYAVSSLIILFLIWWMCRGVDLSKTYEIMKKADLPKLLCIPIGYILLCCFRSFRLHNTPELSNVNPLKLLSIVAIHSFWNNILPARSGELSFLYLTKKHFHMEIGHATGILITIRIYDFLMISMIFVFAASFFGHVLKRSPLLISAALLIFIIIILLLWNLPRLIRILILLIRKINLLISVKEKILHLLGHFLHSTTQMGNIRTHSYLIVSTLFCSISSILIFQIVMISLNIRCSITATIVGSSFALFASMLPLNAPGNTGLLDAGWVLGFLFVGLDKNSAVLSAIVMHSMLIISASIVGLLGYLFLSIKKDEVRK
ncbi:MAG: lysylphosphatidylglycerol synthase transmembrane domain-containing protein [Pseudomonadota bacterium]